jgi:BA14K-like protein
MGTKTKIALAAALFLGTTAVAVAAPDTDPNGGFRESGAGAFATQGINPVYHPTSAANCQKRYKSYDPATMTYLSNGKRVPCP